MSWTNKSLQRDQLFVISGAKWLASVTDDDDDDDDGCDDTFFIRVDKISRLLLQLKTKSRLIIVI